MKKFDSIDEARAATYLDVIEEARTEILKLYETKPFFHAEQLKVRYFVIELMLKKIEKLSEKYEEDFGIEEEYRRAVIVQEEMDKLVPACGRFN